MKTERVIPSRDDREGSVIRERVGAWIAEAYWPLGARGGPTELKLYPADDASPAEVARGISTATIHAVPLVQMTAGYAQLAPQVDDLATALAGEADTRRGRSDVFYALVAEEYVRLISQGERTPVAAIAKRTGKTTDAVRGWVKVARQRGYLTGQPGRTTGELTSKAKEVLREETGS
jgi:hypothetical protein